jgi:hypothetical protein
MATLSSIVSPAKFGDALAEARYNVLALLSSLNAILGNISES